VKTGRAWLPLVMLALLACTPQPPTERIAGRSMGTTYEVVVTRRPAAVTRADLESAVDAVLDEVDRHLSAGIRRATSFASTRRPRPIGSRCRRCSPRRSSSRWP